MAQTPNSANPEKRKQNLARQNKKFNEKAANFSARNRLNLS
ncbi:hypothetical protein [Campylobacter rectus]|nr:hypothetical protein [Campylobacter rectus]